jgi:hypothetical protein
LLLDMKGLDRLAVHPGEEEADDVIGCVLESELPGMSVAAAQDISASWKSSRIWFLPSTIGSPRLPSARIGKP